MHLTKRLVLIFAATLFSMHAFAQVPSTNHDLLIPPGTTSTGSLPMSTVSNTTVGAGDILRITVFGQPDLSAVIGVNDTGAVNLGLIGTVQVNGLTTSEIAKKIEQAYRDGKYILQPEVSVETIQMRSQLVSILGEVNLPGRYPIPGHLSLLELIATAGGLKTTAAPHAFVLRKTAADSDKQEKFDIPLSNPATESSFPEDFSLKTGDVIYIEQKKLIFIHGEVNRAGEYPFEPNMNVMRAISLGGGMNQRASSRRITIFRTENNQSTYIDAKLNTPVKPGDVIDVKESIF